MKKNGTKISSRFLGKCAGVLLLFLLAPVMLCGQKHTFGRNIRQTARSGTFKNKKAPLQEKDLLWNLKKNLDLLPALTAEKFHENTVFPKSELFTWISDTKEAAKFAPEKKDRKLMVFAGETFAEAVVYFKNGSFSRLYISFFNQSEKGNKTYSQRIFRKFIFDVRDHINEVMHLKGKTGRDNSSKFDVKHFLYWDLEKLHIKITWSSKKNPLGGPRYCYMDIVLKKEMSPSLPEEQKQAANENDGEQKASVKKSAAQKRKLKPVKKEELVKRIRKKSGRVYLSGIPGRKEISSSHHVACVLEQVFTYYGRPFEQQKLTESGVMTKDSAMAGASYSNMFAVLKRCSREMKFNIEKSYEFFRTTGEVTKFVSIYNSKMKKMRQKKIQLYKLSDKIDVARTFMNMDKKFGREILLEMKRKNFEKEFCKVIKEKIDEGIPVLWYVYMDFAPGKNHVRGGRLRLITGYVPTMELEAQEQASMADRRRKKTKKIKSLLSGVIYTDLLQKGNKLKITSAEDAWAITAGLYTIDVKN